ncbi:hypothetical protein C3L33_21539, partial [Rhododendron williamsianum]
MKLGLDRRTGLQRFLTSWKSRDDPSTGEYSFQLELKEFPQFILFKGSSRVWRIPAWLKPQRTAKAEDMASSKINGTVVNNRDEVYTSYTLINASNPSIVFVDELGSLKMVTWVGKWVEFYSVPGDQCVYGRCGANGYCDSNKGQDFECTCLPGYKPRSAEEWNLRDASDGCIKKREELSMCGNREGFVKVANTKIPDTSKAHVWMSLSVHECKDECLRNCSCLAYMSQAAGGARAICITWYENLMDALSAEASIDATGTLHDTIEIHLRTLCFAPISAIPVTLAFCLKLSKADFDIKLAGVSAPLFKESMPRLPMETLRKGITI